MKANQHKVTMWALVAALVGVGYVTNNLPPVAAADAEVAEEQARGENRRWLGPAPPAPSAMRAMGQVKLLSWPAQVGSVVGWWRQIGQLLKDREVAPIAPLYTVFFGPQKVSRGSRSCQLNPPRVLTEAFGMWPIIDQDTAPYGSLWPEPIVEVEHLPRMWPAGLLPTPAAPKQLGKAEQIYVHPRMQVARTNLAALVYCRKQGEEGAGPCYLVINHGQPGNVTTVERKLVGAAQRPSGHLLSYDEGRGLLVDLIVGPRDKREQTVYLCHAPEWDLQDLWRSLGYLDNPGYFDILGQSADGNSVYAALPGVLHRHPRPEPWLEYALYRLDTRTATLHKIGDLPLATMGYSTLLPSPDGRLLATGEILILEMRQTNPLWVVDCRTGAAHQVTARDDTWFYWHRAIAWSTKVPGRLYFLEECETSLWQLDLDLDKITGP